MSYLFELFANRRPAYARKIKASIPYNLVDRSSRPFEKCNTAVPANIRPAMILRMIEDTEAARTAIQRVHDGDNKAR